MNESIVVANLVFRITGKRVVITTPASQYTLDLDESRGLAEFFIANAGQFASANVVEAANPRAVARRQGHDQS